MAEAKQRVPENFNALYDPAARAARGVATVVARAAHPAVARLADQVSDLAVDLDEATHNPVQVSIRRPAGSRFGRRSHRRTRPGNSCTIALTFGNWASRISGPWR